MQRIFTFAELKTGRNKKTKINRKVQKGSEMEEKLFYRIFYMSIKIMNNSKIYFTQDMFKGLLETKDL